MDVKSIKVEQYLNEEEAAMKEEKVFLGEPIKVEYPVEDYEYKKITEFGSSNLKVKGDSMPPVEQKKVEDDERNEIPHTGDGLVVSVNPESLLSCEPVRSVEDQNRSSTAVPRVHGRVTCVMDDDDSFHPEFFVECEGEMDLVQNSPYCNTRPLSATFSSRSIRSSLSEDTSNTSTSESPFLQSQVADSVDSSSSSQKRALDLYQKDTSTAKAALNSGKAHITTRGKFREARSMLPPCKESCHRCKTRLSEEQRKIIFDDFWNIQDHSLQWQFILHHMSIIAPKKKKYGAKHKQTTRKYFFRVDETEYQVCKTMFLSTLGVCDSWVDSIVRKLSTCGYVEPDQRGRHKNRPKRTRSETIASIKEHIDSFERIPSHHRRKRPKREYLDPRLSVKKMYLMYRTWAKKSKKLADSLIASERQYRINFNTYFDLGFHQPRKDQCLECNRFRARSKDDTERLKPRIIQHIFNKEDSKKLMNEDKAEGFKSKETVCVCSFDLQKVLQCPRSSNSLFFYRNKMSVSNFTIKDMSSGVGYCYVWDEVTAKRGVNEIASCLWNFIVKKVAEGITEFRFYSDSCSGLNRNRFVFAMSKMAAEKLKIKITHTFLEPGHAQTEVDSIHLRIENATRHSEIFSMNEWIQAIKTAKVTGVEYRVIPVTQEMIFDFKALVEKQQWDLSEKEAKIKWGSVKRVEVDSLTPNEVRFKYFYRGATYKVNLQKTDWNIDLTTYKLESAYGCKLALKAKTVRDLQFLCEKGDVPSQYHAEYSDILGFPVGLARCATWLPVKDPDEMDCVEEETPCRTNSDQSEDKDFPPEDGDDLNEFLAEHEEDAIPSVDADCGEQFPLPDEGLDLDEYFREEISQNLVIDVDYSEDLSTSEDE